MNFTATSFNSPDWCLSSSEKLLELINKAIVCQFSPLISPFRALVLPLLIICGIFGNFISIKIFLQEKIIKGTCRIYYLSIAIADLFSIISFAIPEWTGDGLKWFTNGEVQFWPERLSVYSCRLFRYIWHSSWAISYWIMLVYSIERLVVISFPLIRINLRNLKIAFEM